MHHAINQSVINRLGSGFSSDSDVGQSRSRRLSPVRFWTSSFVAKTSVERSQLRVFAPSIRPDQFLTSDAMVSESSLVFVAGGPDDDGRAPTHEELMAIDSELYLSTENETESNSVPSGEVSRSLKNLLPQARFFSGEDICFDSIATSADQCLPGQLVVYRMGIDCPAELIADALAHGASGILTEQILPVPLPQCIVGDTDRALAEITSRELIDENGSRPHQRLLTIGVVGESGKTSTVLSLATVLRDAPCRVAYETDLGHSDGIGGEVSQTAAVVGSELIKRISEAADTGAALTIIELNDAGLRSGGYDQITFDMMVIVGKNRLRSDFGPSPLQCAIERVSQDGLLVVDVSDEVSMKVAVESGLNVWTYGVDTPADVSLKTFGIEDGVLTAMIRHEMNASMMESTLGRGTLTASLAAAAAVGVITENPLAQIAESLSQLRSVPGRLERVACEDWNEAQRTPNCLFDVGGSPTRMAFVLNRLQDEMRAAKVIATRETFGSPSPVSIPMNASRHQPALWCVLAPSVNDSSETLMQYGRLLETIPDHCIVTCHPSQKQRFLSMCHGVLDGVEDCAAMRLVADQTRAIRWAVDAASPGDTVVVIGGVDRSTAVVQRSDIERIRESMSGGVATAETPKNKPALKLFDPQA